MVLFRCSKWKRFRLHKIKPRCDCLVHHLRFAATLAGELSWIAFGFLPSIFSNETEKSLFTTLKAGHLANSLIFVGTSIKSFDSAVFKLTLSQPRMSDLIRNMGNWGYAQVESNKNLKSRTKESSSHNHQASVTCM
jgi:hypothetical protein